MSDVTDLRPGEEILLGIPGVLYTGETEDTVAFHTLTEFHGIVTAHGRAGKTLLRADKTTETADDAYRIISRGIEYNTRPFTPEDGLWLSRYSIDLPDDALVGLTKQGNEENMDTPETLTAYLDGGFLVGLVYENNEGIWLRADGEWLTVDTLDELSGDESSNFEVDPEQAADLLDLFDGQHVTADEAQAYSIEGA